MAAIAGQVAGVPPQYVTQDQLSIVQTYALDTIPAQISRGLEYSAQRTVVLKFLKGSAKTTLICGVAGAALGALTGIPAGPGAVVAGATKGAAVGIIAGAVLGTYSECVEIYTSKEYAVWRKEKFSIKVLPIYQKFIADNELPVCPISLDVIFIPYVCSHGKTFERDELAAYFQKKKEDAVAANTKAVAEGRNPVHHTTKFLCPEGRNPEGEPAAEDLDSWDECCYDTRYHLNLFNRLKDKSIANPQVLSAV